MNGELDLVEAAGLGWSLRLFSSSQVMRMGLVHRPYLEKQSGLECYTEEAHTRKLTGCHPRTVSFTYFAHLYWVFLIFWVSH